MTPLSEMLNGAKGDSSVDRLIEAAEKRTGESIPSTARAAIYKALKGQHAKSPRDDSLVLWSEVFQLDVRDLREAVQKPRGELGPWTPVTESARLDQDQRDALDLLIKTIVRGGVEDGQRPATTKVAGSGRRLRAVDNEAARDVGRRGSAGKVRDKQDRAGEPPADNPDDMEPR